MKYEFPYIDHIDQVLEVTKDLDHFICAEKEGGYTIINYVVSDQTTFPPIETIADAIRREARGIVFDTASGTPISRRYHKFFNVNEKPETDLALIDLDEPHVLLDKLDGSMVTPLPLKDGMRWGTKMGITDTSKQAETFVASRKNYQRFAQECADVNITPIFEWTSNQNRIVLDYKQDNLVLTAIRENFDGRYQPYIDMVELAYHSDIPVVQAYQGTVEDAQKLIDKIAESEGIEGIVSRWDTGHMAKWKSHWYLDLHRAKDALSSERKLVILILKSELDDLKACLLQEDLDYINDYEVRFHLRVTEIINGLLNDFQLYKSQGIDRKEFAINHMYKHDAVQKQWLFCMWDGKDPRKIVLDTISKYTSRDIIFEPIGQFLNLGYRR